MAQVIAWWEGYVAASPRDEDFGSLLRSETSNTVETVEYHTESLAAPVKSLRLMSGVEGIA